MGLAQIRTKGTYRKLAESLSEMHVKPPCSSHLSESECQPGLGRSPARSTKISVGFLRAKALAAYVCNDLAMVRATSGRASHQVNEMRRLHSAGSPHVPKLFPASFGISYPIPQTSPPLCSFLPCRKEIVSTYWLGFMGKDCRLAFRILKRVRRGLRPTISQFDQGKVSSLRRSGV